MPEPIVKLNVRGLSEVQRFLTNLPRGAIRVVMRAIGNFFVSSEVLQQYPAYKYVSRKQAGYKTSPIQWRKIWAMIRSGEITPGQPNRSGATAAGWRLVETNNGYRMRVENREKGAYFTMGDPGQARQPRMAGWRTITQRIRENMDKAMLVASRALRDFIQRHGR